MYDRSLAYKDVESLQRFSDESVDNTVCNKSFYQTFRQLGGNRIDRCDDMQDGV